MTDQDRDSHGIDGQEKVDHVRKTGGLETDVQEKLGTDHGEVVLDQGQTQGQEDDTPLQDQGQGLDLQGHLPHHQGHSHLDQVQGQDQGKIMYCWYFIIQMHAAEE